MVDGPPLESHQILNTHLTGGLWPLDVEKVPLQRDMHLPMAVPAKVEPKCAHVSDASIQPFLQPDFDAAEYLNNTLPALSSSAGVSRGRAVPLPELSSRLQTLLTQLNAQTSRLSNTLTQLTDEIIRSASRLAYEVEVLRGETLGLTDALENGLRKDIELFAPQKPVSVAAGEGVDAEGTTEGADPPESDRGGKGEHQAPTEPDFLERLRTLTGVRERLDAVIKTFGSAMQWPLAPSELSLASSLISVSAPASSDDTRSREEKGKEYAETIRSEVNELLSTGAEGLEAASARVEELRTLADVWKGTAEEKARLKLIESLQKLVDDKQKTLGRTNAATRKPGASPARAYDHRYGNMETPRGANEGGSGYGFLQNLRNLKNEVYMD